MKHWWQRIVKDYLTFSKRERNGIFILFLVGVLIYFLPQFFKPKKTEINKDAFEKDIAKLKISVDTSRGYKNYYRNDDEAGDAYLQPKHYNDYNNTPKGELFPFDPNTIDAAGWKRLGLRDRTIGTLQKFMAKGFKFRKPEDIRRVYGVRPEEADRLIPYMHIAAAQNNYQHYPANTYTSNNTGNTYPATSTSPPVAYKPRIIDVNQADTSAFISLPGIGSKLAARIVNFRDKLGGFYSVNQVGETYGVPDSTFQKIKPRLQCSATSVKKININTADVNELKSHPYIRYNLANAIINYRKQHGNFASIEDIRKIDIITEEVYNKIAPYLVV
jgi:competence protein ComEA